MVTNRFRARLQGLTDSPGGLDADLRVGGWVIRLLGLDRSAEAALEQRWGPFLEPVAPEPAAATIRLLDAGREAWLGAPRFRGERYRIEPDGEGSERIVVSHNFALDPGAAAGQEWRLAITRETREPIGRIVENAARLALARIAHREGGFAMHAAGVLHRGRAWIYCGPSRSGKSTAVAASAPAHRIGDDFAVVVPRPDGWTMPSLPFDSAETVELSQPRGEFPVAAMMRLYHGDAFRLESPHRSVRTASLLSCAAFPWLYPEEAAELLDRVARSVAEVGFFHLYFGLGTDLYRDLLQPEKGILDRPRPAP